MHVTELKVKNQDPLVQLTRKVEQSSKFPMLIKVTKVT
jgi:hypothetical protein